MPRKDAAPSAPAKPGAALIKGTRREKAQSHRARQRQAAVEASATAAVPQKSVTELGNLDDFLAEAELAGRDFEVERDTQLYFANAQGKLVQSTEVHANDEDDDGQDVALEPLKMPRRPAWVPGQTSPEELDRMEKDAFLEWRRGVAASEAKAERLGMLPTPFEKNLQFWRQLWRVVERCDVLVQVVDARNPCLFRFPDLEAYVTECDAHKTNLLLVNKADMLTSEERARYAAYFARHGVAFCFFSAKLSQSSVDEGGRESKLDEQVLTRDELLERLARAAREAAHAAGRTDSGVVGMAGYPNVGKSSVINSLLGVSKLDHLAARVSVSATPGHTKHFQTIVIGDVTLCDCPGLVFPSFMANKAEMLVNGILPIDEVRGRDFIPALELVVRRVSKRVLEDEYKIKLDLPAEAKRATTLTLLEALCVAKGLFGTGHGRIDESKGARIILKDFVQGRLLYVAPPPGESVDESDEEAVVTEYEMGKHERDEALHLQGTSRRVQRHGRKHRKGRDKNPYEHDAAVFAANVKDTKRASGAASTAFVRTVTPGASGAAEV